MTERLEQQLKFIVEIDKVKRIVRQSKLFSEDRFENDAEHSWHISMMAMILAEHANEPVDVLKVVKMLLIHDLVEIDAGDVIVYLKTDEDRENEQRAAERIFGLLPEDQGREFLALWQEFEERKSPEARFAAAMDRLEPVMQALHRIHEPRQTPRASYEQIIEINSQIGDGAKELWDYAKGEIDRYMEKLK